MNLPASTRQRVASAAKSVLTSVLGTAIVYQEVHEQFTSAAPKTPGWASLAADLPPSAVLGRACLHTLARSLRCNRSAAELATELPYLGVAQGEAKVRQILRDTSPFTEVWRGRWQVGRVAPALLRHLDKQSAQRNLPGTAQNALPRDPQDHHGCSPEGELPGTRGACHRRMSDPSGGVRRMSSPAHGDQHTSASDPFIAQRCACGHPVYSDGQPGRLCTLCACSDHRLRRTARTGTHGTEAPGVIPPPNAVP